MYTQIILTERRSQSPHNRHVVFVLTMQFLVA